MSNQQIEDKARKDADKVKKEIGSLVKDSAARFNKFEDSVSKIADKAKEDLTTKMEDSASQMSGGVEKMSKEARETMVEAAEAVKKDVGDGLSHYNAKAQELADRVPGDFGKKAAKYPWIAILIGLMIGFLLGGLLKPSRQS
jgi:ElaB/YqjD/DUF883 family membrane-anchored ribosome-binding protein